MGSGAVVRPYGGAGTVRWATEPQWTWTWAQPGSRARPQYLRTSVLVEQARREAADRHDALVVHGRLPAGPGDQRGVHVGCFGPQRSHRALLTRPHAEGIELEVLHGVEVR